MKKSINLAMCAAINLHPAAEIQKRRIWPLPAPLNIIFVCITITYNLGFHV